MGDLLFGSTIGMLKNAMSGASDAHAAIANNVANVNTPEFRRTDVSFKESLAASMPRTEDSDELAGAVTDAKHIPIGPEFDAKPYAPTIRLDETQQMRVDGSNVDIDQEMAKLSLNSAYSQTMGQLLGVQYSRLRQAISEKI
jgi:flagellar basal-body rod protein FlgB